MDCLLFLAKPSTLTSMAGKSESKSSLPLTPEVLKIVRLLKKEYPDAACALHFENPLQLLVATILAAQCTDERVNQVTKNLFHKYRSAEDFAAADDEELMKEIHSTGFFRNKTKSIIACCRKIVDEYGGKVPDTLPELTGLPGTGRKTANVVLGNCFNTPGIVADTHVIRVSQRLGLTQRKTGDQVEADLNLIIPQKEWTAFSHRVTAHGRQVCHARNPRCDRCLLYEVCMWEEKEAQKKKQGTESEKGARH